MIELTGLSMALATFVGIWWGHVGVRWLEAHSPNIWPPLVILAIAGAALNIYSLFAPNLTISGVASIIGITLLWDAFEMYRQQKRVLKGHAPANPNNPRHAAFLAQGKGTTEDLIDREPQGKPVPPASATRTTQRPVLTPLKQREYGYEEV
jgi:hypothetical protein